MCTICVSKFCTSIHDALVEVTSKKKPKVFENIFNKSNSTNTSNYTTSLPVINENDVISSKSNNQIRKRYLRRIQPNENMRPLSNQTLDNDLPSNTASKRRLSLPNRRRSTALLTDIDKNEIQYLSLHHEAAFSSTDAEDFKLGKLLLKVSHHIQKCLLTVNLIEAQNLPKTDKFGECDAYAKIVIYPGDYSEQKTNIQRKTRNPKFNEIKVFKQVLESDLIGMTLNVKVYDWNRVMKNHLIGEINCSLGILLENDVEGHLRTVNIHKNIVIATDSNQYLGSILLSLCLDMKSQQLTITVIKGKDLKAMDANALSDPFCSLKLFCDGSKIGSRKTSVKYKTLNPVWNESFPFTVTQKSFTKNLRLNIRVYDRDVTGKEFIGEIDFPSSNGSIEYKHWGNMIDNQNVTIAEWHSLKPKKK